MTKVYKVIMPHFRLRITAVLVSIWILWNYGAVRGEEEDEMGNGHGGAGQVTPKFVSRGQKFRVVIGDTVRLPCQVDNLGPYVLLWKRGPSVLSAGEMKITMDKRIDLVNGFDLEIKKVRPQDGGDYVCQLSTYTPEEQVHTLEILVPPSVRSEPSHIVISKGDTVTLQCRGSGNPVPTITWTRRNNILPNGEQSVVGQQYTLQQADRHQAGTYICTGNNGVGTPVSTQVDVKVQYPPEIEVERGWIHTGENQEAILACIVHSDPPALKVKWYRDTMILDTDGRRLMEERGSRHSLIIRKVQHSDFGNYSCEAYNKLGRSTKHIELSGKPNRAIFRSDPVGRMRDSFNITWTVESYNPVDEYRLSYRKKHVNETHDIPGPWLDVVLPAAPGETSSFYERNALQNRGGGGGGSGGASGLVLQTSVINWKSYHIRNLDPGVIYEAKVTARNKYGWGQTSDLFQFNTRSSDHYPYESSPQHDVLAEPEVRDMRITSPTSFASTVHPSLFLSALLPLLTLAVIFASAITFTSSQNHNKSSNTRRRRSSSSSSNSFYEPLFPPKSFPAKNQPTSQATSNNTTKEAKVTTSSSSATSHLGGSSSTSSFLRASSTKVTSLSTSHFFFSTATALLASPVPQQPLSKDQFKILLVNGSLSSNSYSHFHPRPPDSSTTTQKPILVS